VGANEESPSICVDAPVDVAETGEFGSLEVKGPVALLAISVTDVIGKQLEALRRQNSRIRPVRGRNE
jgi:hypothetical protein